MMLANKEEIDIRRMRSIDLLCRFGSVLFYLLWVVDIYVTIRESIIIIVIFLNEEHYF